MASTLSKPQGRGALGPGDTGLPSEGFRGLALWESQPRWQLEAPGTGQEPGRGPPRSGRQGVFVTGGAALTPRQPRTVVIKAMGDLVPNHHPDAPKVQGLWLLLAEERGLEDPGGKHCGGEAVGDGMSWVSTPVYQARGGHTQASCHLTSQPGR